MFSVLIADDEPLQRNSLVKIIQQLRPKWRIHEAENGQQLISLLSDKVQIVFTDIRMPEMDGIQGAAIIKSKFPEVKVVFVSAYNDFEYAQTAITYGVSDYLLKPVLQKDLEPLLCKLEGAIEKDMGQAISAKKETARAKAITVYQWLNQKLSAEYLSLLPKQLCIPLSGRISVFKFKQDGNSEAWWKDSFSEDIAAFIQAESMAHLTQPLQAYFCYPEKFEIAVISAMQVPVELLQQFFRKVSGEIYQDTMLSCRVGISSAQKDLPFGGPLAYKQAKFALQNHFYYPAASIFVFDGQQKWDSIPVPAKLAVLTKKLESGFFEQDRQYAIHQYQEILTLLLQAHLPPQKIRDELTFVLKRAIFALNHQLEAEEYQRLILFLESAVYDDTDAQTLSKNLPLLVDFAMQLLHTEKLPKTSTLLQISNCIKNMPVTQVSLTSMAAYFNYTPSYFSKIFKEEYGVSFSEYLCNYRMNVARELLSQGKYKVSEVSAQVGLTETRYFSKLFKKKYGVTPDEFRRTCKHLSGD